MVVYVNITNLFLDPMIDGIGQVVIHLLNGLEKLGYANTYKLLISPYHERFVAELFPNYHKIVIKPSFLANVVYYKKNFIRSAMLDAALVKHPLLSQSNAILYHPYHALSIRIPKNTKTVVHVHDCLVRNYPEPIFSIKRHLCEAAYQRFTRHADVLIVPSNYVKKDISHHFSSVDPKKIHVISNPIKTPNSRNGPCPIPQPYILSVNSVRKHKNVGTLIDAFMRVCDRLPHKLVLIGAIDSSYGRKIRERIHKKYEDRVLFMGYVNDALRDGLYQSADLFVSTSLHEGFGFTPIEAALYEIPVLTTQMTALYETTCGLLNYVKDPLDPAELSQRMIELLFEKQDKAALQHVKQTFLKIYRCTTIASAFHSLFQSIAHGTVGSSIKEKHHV